MAYNKINFLRLHYYNRRNCIIRDIWIEAKIIGRWISPSPGIYTGIPIFKSENVRKKTHIHVHARHTTLHGESIHHDVELLIRAH